MTIGGILREEREGDERKKLDARAAEETRFQKTKTTSTNTSFLNRDLLSQPPPPSALPPLLRKKNTLQDEGRARYGAPLRVTPFTHPESGEPWGFDLDILSLSSTGNDGDPVSASLRIGFDDGIVNKRQWVGRGTDGFPKMEGDETPIRGKCFEIRKVGDGSVDADTKVVIKNFCSMLEQAVNKYYAFGSCFSDDAT